ncbi:leucine-rich PPR motif-containing protein, mitochondrial [Plutella xylostella]|uniref:leucine-rich PPR motif-containing protein, mitochondrial n=1 Tax=Plutella xylostella TaxID=51655 RepID=UPI00203261C7|nr:leucine-rich PPR motif-containing protein, mitochondrial [Plutella xylostella]
MLSRNFLKLRRLSRLPFDSRVYSHISDKMSLKYDRVSVYRSVATSAYSCSYQKQDSRNPGYIRRPAVNTISRDFQPKLSNEELLEKHMTSLSTDLHLKNRVYMNDLTRVLNKIKETNFSTKKQGLFLIRCCTHLLPEESAASRMELVEEIWNILRSHTKFDIDHYNELLRVYIANNRTLNAASFITKMSPVKPNSKTYELLLRALGEAGDINQATEVISNMKAQGLPATESIFNSLIVCQGKAGNLQNISEVLIMMKSLKIDQTIDTCTAIARAYAWNRKDKQMLEEMNKTTALGLSFDEKHIMEIVKTLAFLSHYDPIPKVLQFLPESTLKCPSISSYMQSVCTLLVFQNHPLPALEIYKCLPLPSFGPRDDTGLHGRSLVRDCVKASLSTSVITLITQELMSSGRNIIALQCACEAALQYGKVPMALDLFIRMRQMGMPIRPHYFWPILLHSSASYGEKGIMNTLKKMVEMEVPADFETLTDYVLPYVSLSSPQSLMRKLRECGLGAAAALAPVAHTLLNQGQLTHAMEIVELYQGKLDGEKLMKPLLKAYFTTLDTTSTAYLLEDITKKATEKDKDWVGRFLCEHIQHKKMAADVSDFVKMLKEIKKRNLKISTSAADFCLTRLPPDLPANTVDVIKSTLVECTDERIVDELDTVSVQMPHPKHMNEESLRAHLNELEAKGMNTRGVLRKLLQRYCQEGNLNAAREIREKCEREGIFLSAGMKASIFDLHVKLGELELAEMSLAELNKSSPNFSLDEYKVIDFATLMVYRGKIQKAMDLINDQSKKRRIIGGRSIELNCWRLLDATAAHGNERETRNMFNTLVNYGYCKPSNTILGPLIRVHLKNDKIQEALKEFTEIATKYKKTPLKHELLVRILTLMSDGHTEENFLINEKANSKLNKHLQASLNMIKKVHGAGDVPLTLIAALAEVGYKKTLRKLLLDPTMTFHPEALLRRCERFAHEKKLAALEAIAECARERRGFNVEDIYELILSVHQRDDNVRDALSLWNKMQENDISPSPKFIDILVNMLKANNTEIPTELSMLQVKTRTKASNK